MSLYDLLEHRINSVEGFKTDRFANADFAFAGATGLGAISSKRYDAFLKTLTWGVKNDEIEHCSWYNKCNNVENWQDVFMSSFYETILRNKKTEDWELCYSQVNFDTKVEEIESEIVKLYGGIKEVFKIYSSQSGDELQIQILTNNSTYNRALMMHLLDIEYDIELKYDAVRLSFDYIPEIYTSEDEVVIGDAKLIYHKIVQEIENELTSTTSTAGTPQQTIRDLFIPVPCTV